MADHPLEDVVKAAEAQAANGHSCFQKFTCEKCGSRQTMETPNVFYTSGSCEECGHVTDIKKKGCNFIMITVPPEIFTDK